MFWPSGAAVLLEILQLFCKWAGTSPSHPFINLTPRNETVWNGDSLTTHSLTHTHSAVNEGGVHPPGLLYYICTQLPAEWKKETVRRRRGDFTVTKWSEGFGGEDTQHLWRTKQTTAADYSNRGLRRSAGQVEAFNSQLPNETQTTGRQQQTRKGTEPICSASRVSAHLAQTGGRAQPLTAETPLVLTRIKKKKKLAARSLSVFSELLHTCNTFSVFDRLAWNKSFTGRWKKIKKRSLTATSSTR